MKKTVFINFGTAQYVHRQMLQLFSAKCAGKADRVRGYHTGDLRKLGFYKLRPWALPSQRGCAFWSWKPFIIHHELQQLQDGDILIYSDIGRPWVRMFRHSLAPVREWLEERLQDVMPGVYIPYTGTVENWTKATTLQQMGVFSADILNSPPIQASFSIWRKSRASLELAEEWEEKSRHLSLIGDNDPGVDAPNGPAFRDHRHDQSILSILCYQRRLQALGHPSGPPVLKDDKDLDAWLQLRGAPRAGACTVGMMNALSAGTRILENAGRSCLNKLKPSSPA